MKIRLANIENRYRRVASSNLSRLEPHPGFYRLLMKGNFDNYLLWPFDKKIIFGLVTGVNTCAFPVLENSDWTDTDAVKLLLLHFNKKGAICDKIKKYQKMWISEILKENRNRNRYLDIQDQQPNCWIKNLNLPKKFIANLF